MGLHFIFGTPGTGKTARCMEEIEAYLRGGQERKAFFVVPDQSTYTAEVRFAERLPERGFTNVDLCGFSRLAYRICRENGASLENAVSPLGEQIILRRLLEAHEEEWHIIGGQSSRPRFSETMAQFFHRLETYCLTETDLFTAAEGEGDSLLGKKLHDMAVLYASYRAYLCEHFSYEGSILDVFAKEIPRSETIRRSRIWIDGFYNLAPQKVRLVSALVDTAEEVTVTIPCMHPSEAAQNPNYAQAYHLYEVLGKEHPHFDVVTLDKPRRFACPRVEAVATSFFEVPLEPCSLPIDEKPVPERGVHIVPAPDTKGEAEFLARRILTLVREGDFRYRDILVLLRSPEVYGERLERTFQRYGIPAFIDGQRPMNNHPLVVLLGGLLRFLSGEKRRRHGGYTRKMLFRLLKTDLLSALTEEETDRLENYALRYHIQYGKWHKEWDYREYWSPDEELGPMGEEERKTLRLVNTWRTKVLALFEPLAEAWKQKLTVREKCIRLYDWLVEAGVAERLAAWDDEEFAQTQMRPHVQVWKKVLSLLEEVVHVAGDDVLPEEEWLIIMEDGLSDLTFSMIPPTLDHVTVTSVNRGFSGEAKAVFLLGVNEGDFPKRTQEEPLFSEREKQTLVTEHGLALGSTLLQNIREEQFFVCLALTRASHTLTLTYPLRSDDGGEKEASFLLKRMESLGYGVEEEALSLPSVDNDDEVFFATPATALALLPGVLQEGIPSPDSNWTALKNYAANHVMYRGLLQKEERQLARKNVSQRLTPSLAALLFKPGGRFYGSVTRLETYRKCPYQYFLRYGVGADERKEGGADLLDFGNYLHAGLHKFGTYLGKERRQWRDATDEEIVEISEKISEEIAPRINGDTLRDTGASRYTHRLLNETFRRTLETLRQRSQNSDFDTTDLEREFFARIEVDGGDSFTLRGKIDRIDSDGKAFAIFDYKTGTPDLKLQEIITGYRLQLMTYLLAMMKEQGREGLMPAAVMYIYLSGDTRGMETVPPGGEAPPSKGGGGTGYFVADRELLKKIDHLAGEDDGFLPVSFKNDGSLRSSVRTLTAQEMGYLLRRVQCTLVSLYERMCSGDITIQPIRMGGRSPCEYCPYLSVCRFDVTRPENRYDYVRNVSDSDIKKGWKERKEEDL